VRIIAAAIRLNGLTVSLPPPARHFHIMKLLNETHRKFGNSLPSNQGFVSSDGRFLERGEALRIATEAGQLLKPSHSSELFSEDLW
jgi:hypothetical protein